MFRSKCIWIINCALTAAEQMAQPSEYTFGTEATRAAGDLSVSLKTKTSHWQHAVVIAGVCFLQEEYCKSPEYLKH